MRRNFFNAFSIAEAMITLLIISVVASAMAPIMSKRIKNNSAEVKPSIPKGAIMFFNGPCPKNWTDVGAGYEGRFIRPANATYGVGHRGEDNIRGHWHYTGRRTDRINSYTIDRPGYQIYIPRGAQHRLVYSAHTGPADNYWGNLNDENMGTTDYIYEDDAHRIQRGAVETQPRYIALRACSAP